MSTSVTTGTSISTITGYKAFGEARIGDNGDSGGSYEGDVGASGSATATLRRVWDQDTSDGIDSGPVDVTLLCKEGGGTNGVQLSVDGASPATINCSTASYSTLTSVKVRAGTIAAGTKCTISSIVAKFYKNGSLQDTVSYSSDLMADALNADDPIAAEAVLTMTPGHSDNTRVVVTCGVQFEVLQDTYPDPSALFATIFVF